MVFRKLKVLFWGLVIVSFTSSSTTFLMRSGVLWLFSNASVELVVTGGVLISNGVLIIPGLFTVMLVCALKLKVMSSASLLHPIIAVAAREIIRSLVFIKLIFTAINV